MPLYIQIVTSISSDWKKRPVSWNEIWSYTEPPMCIIIIQKWNIAEIGKMAKARYTTSIPHSLSYNNQIFVDTA